MSENYLLLHHKKNVIEIMQDKDTTKHFSININFVELFEYDSTLGNAILKEPEKTLEEWNEAARKVQTVLQPNHEEDYTIKTEVTCRVYGLPVYPEYHRTVLPSKDDVNKFLQVSGTVVRMASTKMLEYQRHYVCVKCKYPTVIKAQYDKKYVITPPKNCTNPELCKSTNLITVGELDSDNCKNFQEIKIQELLSIGTIPHSMWVTLEDDLVDVCKPGDSIIVCGIVKQRWDGVFVGKKINVALAIKANHIVVNNENASRAAVTSEIKLMFETFWSRHCEEPLIGRDLILKSFCPQIFGMHMVKLAMAVVLAGGSQLVNEDFSTGVRMRSESHLLLVGDPGTGKSQLLRFASKIIPRSVLTTGIGSTAAGLTVTAVMENGEWQLEAGALVLADGGICCIDEFNSMKERDRTSIHEAMEQQTISVAKASIVCTLNTRCSILAACNPKGNIDINQSLSMCTTLASPLLSRFDVILLLKDNVRNDWENLVTDYILNENHNYSSLINSDIWNVEILQAYYATIKKLNPTLTEDAKEILSRYYQMQRQTNLRNKARTTVRLLHSLIRLSQGHARLMFHNEVKVIDAVYALILVDASMDSDCALLNLNLNAHSTFPDNSTIAYQNMLEVVLNRLKLPEILQKEMDTYGTGVKSTTVKSRFFNGEPEAINPGSTCKDSFPQNNEDSTVRKNQQSCAIVPGVIEETLMDSNKSASAKSEVELEHSVQVNESKRKKLQSNNDVTTSKPKKTKRKDSDVRLEKPGKKFKKKQPLNNMEMLNLFPSINDDIFNMDLNADYSIHLDLDSSFQEDIVISSTQRSEELSPKTKKPETLDVNSVTLPSAATSKSDKTKSKMELFREQFVFKPREKTVVPTEVRKCSQASIFEDSSADVVDFDL